MEFRDVEFSYGTGSAVLRDFSFHLRPGETVALVGRTGCGKSTVSRLIPRFYDVTSGAVLVDGNDVRDLTVVSLRSHIGMVTDEPFLFSESVRDNIAFGRPDAQFDDVEAAARAAGAHDFILELSDGYDTVIGERGYTLSGGQRQRIAIARTLLVNPRILMLDDATSAIDAQREFEIHGALRTLMRGRTTLIIAHRLSTISLADRVLVMEGGRIVADGRHDELLRDVPLYREILAHAEEEYEREHEQEHDDGRGGGAPEADRAARPQRARWRSDERARPRRGCSLMWGGGGGGMMMGPPPAAQGAMWGTAPGTQFAGIPPDMLDKVQHLFKKEPEYELLDIPFSQVVDEDEKPFTLRQLLWPKRIPILGVLILVAFEAFALQFGPRLVELAINNGINVPDPDFGYVAGLAAIYVGLLVAATIIGAIRTLWSGRIGEEVLYGLRVRVFSHIQRLSLDYFTEEKAGRIMTRVTSDIEAIQVLFQQGLVNMWLQLCTLVVIVWQLFAMSSTLALWVVLFVIPVMTIMTAWFRTESDHGYLAVRDWIAGLMSDLQENLSGTRVVAASNRQGYNRVKHANIVGEYRKANLYTGHIAGIYGPGSQLVGVLAQGLVVLIGGNMVLDGQLSIGAYGAFLLYLVRLFAPIQQLAQLYNTYQQGNAATTKLRELFATFPSVREKPDATELPPIEGRITLQDVTFGYSPDTLVLEHVDLSIAEGETFALVGPTGAGKSTIAKLLTRFYDPLEGGSSSTGTTSATSPSTRCAGSWESCRRSRSCSRAASATTSSSPGPKRRVRTCSRRVRQWASWSSSSRCPTGSTPRATNAESRCRRASASSSPSRRAFLASPRVLILDEATSSLDLATESLVERALDVLLEGRTAILIAHRLNTAMRADRIAVVEEGGLVEVGSHAELIAMDGRYAAMFHAWQQSHEAHAFE